MSYILHFRLVTFKASLEGWASYVHAWDGTLVRGWHFKNGDNNIIILAVAKSDFAH